VLQRRKTYEYVYSPTNGNELVCACKLFVTGFQLVYQKKAETDMKTNVQRIIRMFIVTC